MIFFASHSFWCSYSAGIVDDARRSRGERTCYAAIFCLGCHASCCKTYRSPQYLESWILHVCLSLSFSLPPLLSPPSLRLCVCDCQSVSVSACWSVFRPHLCVCVCLSRIRLSLFVSLSLSPSPPHPSLRLCVCDCQSVCMCLCLLVSLCPSSLCLCLSV